MTEYQFWHGDLRLFEAYRKAYMRNVAYSSWYQGMYNRIACEIGAKNALITKKEQHIDKWIDFIDPIEKIDKPIVTKDNLEELFRKQQIEQQSWLFNR